MTDDIAVLKVALEKGPTPKWFTAGREDMQSYSLEGRPFKNLYNDDIAGTSEAARVEGDNSIPDSQYIAACSPDRIQRIVALVERYEVALKIIASGSIDGIRYAPDWNLRKEASDALRMGAK